MRSVPGAQGRQVSKKKGIEDNPKRPIDLMKDKIDSSVGRDIYGQ